MHKLLENLLIKYDLFSIDKFVCQYGNLGFLHPELSVEMTYFDCNEEIEISGSKFDFNNSYHYYFVNYDKLIPIFDFGLFYNATLQVFSDLSNGFRKELKDYLLTINDLTTKKLTAYEIKLHFIGINEILSSLENLNSIQKETINLFLAQYQKEIAYLDKLSINYSESFSSYSTASNVEMINSIIENFINEKTERLTAKVSSIDEKISEELLSIEEAQKFLGLKTTTFWRLRRDGVIKEYMLGTQKYFKKSEIINSLVATN